MDSLVNSRKRRRASSATSNDKQFASEQLAALPNPIKLSPDSHLAIEDIRFILSYLPLWVVIDMFASSVSDNQVQAWEVAKCFNALLTTQKIECASKGDTAGLSLLPPFVARSASLTHLSAAQVASMLAHFPPFAVIDMFASVILADQSLGWTIARRFNDHIIRHKWELAKQVEKNATRSMPEAHDGTTVSVYKGENIYILNVRDIVNRLNSSKGNGNDSTRDFSDEEINWVHKYVLPLGVFPYPKEDKD